MEKHSMFSNQTRPRFHGERKHDWEGRNVLESLFLPLDGFVELGSTKKISDLWALRERVGVIFLVEDIFNFFGSL